MPSRFRKRYRAAALVAALALAATMARAQDCARLDPADRDPGGALRTVEAEDLIGLRDIGPVVSADPTLRILSISPDGRKVAFQLRRADLVTNSYCMGMVVVDLVSRQYRFVDRGGDLTRVVQTLHGLADYPSGFVAVVTPQWSPDSKWIAYLRQYNGVAQVWRALAAGGEAVPVTHLAVRPDAYAWTADGRAIVVVSRPGLVASRDAVKAEGQDGYLYDDRFVPFASSAPFPRDVPKVYQTIDVATGAVRPATPDDVARLATKDPGLPPTAGLRAKSAAGTWAWTELKEPDKVNAATTLHVRLPAGDRAICAGTLCDRVRDLWWTADGKALVYLNREGADLSHLAVYRLGLHDTLPTRLFDTEDALIGCAVAGHDLVCADEAATQPRRIIAIDLVSGTVRSVFDPNPEWRDMRLGQVERLRWTNAYGIATFGDLVLPPAHRPGDKHPLIIVQYESRGFLRGGTGDEYPIQLYAAHGYAVLSVQGPVSISWSRGAASPADVNRLDRVDWADRRSILSSLESGVRAAMATGAVDGDRIGITGLSEGASSAQFALLNSHLFKAAAVSTCCDESSVINILDGPGGTPWYRSMGYPPLTGDHAAFWKDMSLRDNAATMSTPLLMQIGDGEYLGAIESYAALREHDQPVELYVFPDEYHFKWQPVHRRAVYMRSLDWFDFWLRGSEDPGPSKAPQYARWTRLEHQSQQALSASPGE